MAAPECAVRSAHAAAAAHQLARRCAAVHPESPTTSTARPLCTGATLLYFQHCGCSHSVFVLTASRLRAVLDSNPFFDPRRQRFVLQLFKGGR